MSNARDTGVRRRSFFRLVCGWLCAAAAVAVWLPGADVVELIATQRDVILGRYDENQAYFLLLFTPLSIAAAAILLSRTALNRVLAFKLLTVAVSCILVLVLVDVTGRILRSPRYEEIRVEDLENWPRDWDAVGSVKTRPPGIQYQVSYEDIPSTARTFPDPPPGFAPVDVTLSVDERGFRNPTALDQADVLILGDSFAEGSRIDDREVWGRMLEKKLGIPVYNLAISGTSPVHYVNHLVTHGLDLDARLVLCMIYEGNDFKTHREYRRKMYAWPRRVYAHIRQAVRTSPVVRAVRDLGEVSVCRWFADRSVPGWEELSWMPLRIAGEQGEHYVAFHPKRLERLYYTPEQFRAYRGWQRTQDVLRDLKRICDQAGMELVFIYAPSAPHVLLPIVIDDIPASGLHRFLGMAAKKLPEPEYLKRSLPEIVGTCEREFTAFAHSIGAQVISPTRALRAAASEGRQVYYTYDQHWTGLGHAVVADQVLAWLQEHPEVFAAQ